MKINGFCISFIGFNNIIDIGYYKNNKRNGNLMRINGTTWNVVECGFYKDNVRICENMKECDKEYKCFKLNDIFIQPVGKGDDLDGNYV